ncbi:MAG TPA: hypothetical protein VG103_05785 [Chthoniobacterales bacterium]|nr:hypothetical protein [Chthoniobacterales bacterium]
MSLLLIVLHVRVLVHAGPLWRDEVSSFYVATAPNLQAFRDSLVLDPFPILFVTVLRVWIALGFGSSDFGLRLLAFLIGTSLIGAIWLCCRMIDKERWAPLWPLALFGLTPVTLIEGDSLRAYGLGLIGIVMSFGLVWRLAFRPWRLGTAVAAAICALLAVQSLYLNSLILFAICLAGIIASFRRKQFVPLAGIFFVGLIAALSLLPYAGIMRDAHEQLALQREFQTVSNGMSSLISAGALRGTAAKLVCILLFSIGLSVVSLPSLRRPLFDRIKGTSDSLVFAMIVVMAGAITTFGFLWSSGVHSPRYRLPFTAAATLSMQVVYVTLRKNIGLTVANLVGSGLTAAAFIPSSYHLSELRRTNCDLAAAVVANSAAQDDLVIVTRFTHAPTFQRYYRGTAPWTSVPAVADHLQHRAYLARSVKLNPDTIRDILLSIESELKAGHKVFLVGRFPLSEIGRPVSITSTPESGSSWRLGIYLNMWRSQIVNLLGQHAVQVLKIALNESPPIDPQEKEDVFLFSGWKD